MLRLVASVTDQLRIVFSPGLMLVGLAVKLYMVGAPNVGITKSPTTTVLTPPAAFSTIASYPVPSSEAMVAGVV
jgi:hypothetical protein